jgi:hypothetical protein
LGVKIEIFFKPATTTPETGPSLWAGKPSTARAWGVKILFKKIAFHDKNSSIMIEKVYITSKQTATFTCPKCRKAKTVDVSQYAQLDKIVRVNVKCPCGCAHTSILDKRRQYRKETNLHGSYTRIVNGREAEGGLMTVRDLSTGGLKLQINDNHGCSAGDVVKVEFYLDDAQRSFIKKKVIVRNIHKQTAGMEFVHSQVADKALGFYLLR